MQSTPAVGIHGIDALDTQRQLGLVAVILALKSRPVPSVAVGCIDFIDFHSKFRQ